MTDMQTDIIHLHYKLCWLQAAAELKRKPQSDTSLLLSNNKTKNMEISQ